MSNAHTIIDSAGGADIAEGLRATLALRRLADSLEGMQVSRARAAGWSWAQIAQSLDISKQAAHKKYAHLDARK
ncbi:RNA polymerase subunit sigma-70 [Granulicoccus sp. GXG6511]|uniref:RNA polymerase subunit sigma-70 n=1 Tax=Granulicoccus sp. GXG6511 TaxID=3381351 RepID=UPI003D7EC471